MPTSPKASASRPTADELRARRRRMIDYLDLRRSLEDWHGVQDAASDVREIEAQLAIVEGRAR